MISTTQNMMAKLLWLATASHAVRLLDGASDDGITKGNIDAPAVRMMPATVRPLARNAASVQRRALQRPAGVVVEPGAAGAHHRFHHRHEGRVRIRHGRDAETIDAVGDPHAG